MVMTAENAPSFLTLAEKTSAEGLRILCERFLKRGKGKDKEE